MNRPTKAVALALFLMGASASWAQSLPPGWRLPTEKEMAELARNDSASRFAKAVADFNGDGIRDEAFVLKSTRFSGEALWVRLSSADKQFNWIKLDETNWGEKYPNVDLSMGIDVQPPGTYPYGCFKDAKDCNFGPDSERPKLKLRDPSLMYFKMESAASLYFWSKTHKKFMRVWLSD
jgi:hypothetical protein